MFSVGVRAIDEQHQVLVGILNRLGASVQEGAPPLDQSAILNELVAYTQTHFSFEEGLMRQAGYADIEAHLRQHHALLGEVRQLTARDASGAQVHAEELIVLVRDWLTAHILSTDRALGTALNAAGIR